MKPTNRQLQAFSKFLKKLPHGNDQVLVILKGHLLIEEQVRLIINRRLDNPSAFHETRVDCHQAICLAQSFFPSGHSPDFWMSLKKLNKIRNDIAHKTEAPGLSDKIVDFIKSVPVDWEVTDKQMEFELSLWALFVHISSFVEGSMEQGMEMYIPEIRGSSR